MVSHLIGIVGDHAAFRLSVSDTRANGSIPMIIPRGSFQVTACTPLPWNSFILSTRPLILRSSLDKDLITAVSLSVV